MATSTVTSDIYLKYRPFYTHGKYGIGREYGTDAYLNYLLLTIPDENLKQYCSTVNTTTNAATGGQAGSPGSVNIHLAGMLLMLKSAYYDTPIPAEITIDDQGGNPIVVVRDVQFDVIKTVKTMHMNDYYGGADFTEIEDPTESSNQYVELLKVNQHQVHVTLDLRYEVFHQNTNKRYLKLLSVNNIRIYEGTTQVYSDTVETTTDAFQTLWEEIFDEIFVVDLSNKLSAFVQYIYSNMGQYINELNFNDIDVKALGRYTNSVNVPDTATWNAINARYVSDVSSEITTWTPDSTCVKWNDFIFSHGIDDPLDIMLRTNPELSDFDPLTNTYTLTNQILKRNYLHVVPTGTDEFGYEQYNVIEDATVQKVPEMVAGNALVNAYERYIELSLEFITPMEYYAQHSAAETSFDGKLESTVNIPTEPVYFWVETLKNWCTYKGTVASDACTVAELYIWNGFNDFVPLYK